MFGSRAMQADMGIAPSFMQRNLLRQAAAPSLSRCDAIGVAEIHTARERGGPVDHHDLAVIALVESGEAVIERIQRVECAQGDAGLAQGGEELAFRGERSDRVIQHVNAHAAPRRLREEAAQLAVVVNGLLENETLDEHEFARLFDGGEHCFVGARTVDQQLDAVTGEQWRCAYVAHGAKVVIEQRRRARRREFAGETDAGGTADHPVGAFQIDRGSRA
jgi:hypothetical protein